MTYSGSRGHAPTSFDLHHDKMQAKASGDGTPIVHEAYDLMDQASAYKRMNKTTEVNVKDETVVSNGQVVASKDGVVIFQKLKSSDEVFVKMRDGQHAIKPEGVIQDKIGDCFFMATLSGLARTNEGKQSIANMIKTNADGSYTVTFPGAKNEPIKVNPEDYGKYGGNMNQDSWASVLETAFLKYAHNTPLVGNVLKDQGVPRLGRGTTARESMMLLTGRNEAADTFGSGFGISYGATTIENVDRNLRDAIKSGKVVTTNTGHDFLSPLLGGTSPGPLAPTHIYTVLDYDPSKKVVTVRNPWGSMVNTPLQETGATVDGITHLGDGKLQMSLDTFYGHFEGIDVSNEDPLVHSMTNSARSSIDSLNSYGDAGEAFFNGKFRQAAQHLERAQISGRSSRQEQVAGSITDVVRHPMRVLLPMYAAKTAVDLAVEASSNKKVVSTVRIAAEMLNPVTATINVVKGFRKLF